MKNWLAIAAIALPIMAATTAHAQNQTPLSNCYSLHFSKGDMGSDYYTNICDERIGISLIFPRGGLFAFEVAPGKSDGTGHSQSDYERMGQPGIFVCPSGTRPVDDNGRFVTLNTEHYSCKR